MRKKLSREEQEKRKPPPPDVLTGALQDTVHKEVGNVRAAKSIKVKQGDMKPEQKSIFSMGDESVCGFYQQVMKGVSMENQINILPNPKSREVVKISPDGTWWIAPDITMDEIHTVFHPLLEFAAKLLGEKVKIGNALKIYYEFLVKTQQFDLAARLRDLLGSTPK